MNTRRFAGSSSIAVLFVHGIGEQRPGDTLTAAGEPLVKWRNQWQNGSAERDDPSTMDAGSEGDVTFVDAYLKADSGGAVSPAHARIRFSQDGDEWLLAESYWAEDFRPPSFRQVATWVLRIAPQVMFFEAVSRWRRLEEHTPVPARLLAPAWLLGVLACIPVVMALLLGLIVLTAVPIARVRAFATKVGAALVGGVGDSFVLDSSPIRRAAIVGRVRRDIRSLDAQKPGRIVVIAHSQGAAIVHEALRDETLRPAAEVTLITYGSGLAKLALMRRLRDSANSSWMSLAAGFCGLAL